MKNGSHNLTDTPYRLPDPMLIFDQGKSDEIIALIAKTNPWRNRDLSFFDEEL